ncbi:MAG: M48 family metallopeptidase [Gammaproteobacteria bacterium]|nr:M48 family metallopeptidase [Gammaproteobacteria bacterium]
MRDRKTVQAGGRWLGAMLSLLFAGSAAADVLEGQSAKVFEEMKQRMPLAQNERMVAAVECVASSIVSVLDGATGQQPWEVAVFDDPSINAFALAGGKIGVHTGIFQVANNQNALAAVLGHEIAHVTEHHVGKRVARQTLTGIGVVALAIMVPGAAGTSQAVAEAASLGAELGLNKPYDRKAEIDADVTGLRYMARAGFDPRETIDLWRAMEKLNKDAIPEFLSTHPSNDNRAARLVEALPEAIAEYERARAAGRTPECEK